MDTTQQDALLGLEGPLLDLLPPGLGLSMEVSGLIARPGRGARNLVNSQKQGACVGSKSAMTLLSGLYL